MHIIPADSVKTIALVGASDKPERASYKVMEFLIERGYTVYPVNPNLEGQTLQGQKVYSSLASVPPPVDMVEIFRETNAAAAVIQECVMLKDNLHIKNIWCQLGVTPTEAADFASRAGIKVVVDKCPAIEWR
ncbi:MAG: hypothetical protein C0436_01795 [Alphaproteobacteria bacterium]|nr:hypothetical protein [Alphaproteobacteria bacterium]